MSDIWYPLKNYEGLYEITKSGKIRRTPRELKTTKDAQGYQVVQLRDCNGNIKNKKLHRLIAETFLENPENKPCVDHINTVRTDNRVENLRWATYTENMNNPLTVEKLNQYRNAI